MLALSQAIRTAWIHKELSQLPREVLRLMSGSSLERVFRPRPRREDDLIQIGKLRFPVQLTGRVSIGNQSYRIAKAPLPARKSVGRRR